MEHRYWNIGRAHVPPPPPPWKSFGSFSSSLFYLRNRQKLPGEFSPKTQIQICSSKRAQCSPCYAPLLIVHSFLHPSKNPKLCFTGLETGWKPALFFFLTEKFRAKVNLIKGEKTLQKPQKDHCCARQLIVLFKQSDNLVQKQTQFSKFRLSIWISSRKTLNLLF